MDAGFLQHIAAHGILKAEVEHAVEGRRYCRKTGGLYTMIGRGPGRTLFIVLAPSTSLAGFVEVVTARPATRMEKRLLARRGKNVL